MGINFRLCERESWKSDRPERVISVLRLSVVHYSLHTGRVPVGKLRGYQSHYLGTSNGTVKDATTVNQVSTNSYSCLTKLSWPEITYGDWKAQKTNASN